MMKANHFRYGGLFLTIFAIIFVSGCVQSGEKGTTDSSAPIAEVTKTETAMFLEKNGFDTERITSKLIEESNKSCVPDEDRVNLQTKSDIILSLDQMGKLDLLDKKETSECVKRLLNGAYKPDKWWWGKWDYLRGLETLKTLNALDEETRNEIKNQLLAVQPASAESGNPAFSKVIIKGLKIINKEDSLNEKFGCTIKNKVPSDYNLPDTRLGCMLLESKVTAEFYPSSYKYWISVFRDLDLNYMDKNIAQKSVEEDVSEFTMKTFLGVQGDERLEDAITAGWLTSANKNSVVEFIKTQQLEDGGFGNLDNSKKTRSYFTLVAARDLGLLNSLDDGTKNKIINYYKGCFDYNKVLSEGDCSIDLIVKFSNIVSGNNVDI